MKRAWQLFIIPFNIRFVLLSIVLVELRVGSSTIVFVDIWLIFSNSNYILSIWNIILRLYFYFQFL